MCVFLSLNVKLTSCDLEYHLAILATYVLYEQNKDILLRCTEIDALFSAIK